MNSEAKFFVKAYSSLTISCSLFAAGLWALGVPIWPSFLLLIGVATFWGFAALLFLGISKIFKS